MKLWTKLCVGLLVLGLVLGIGGKAAGGRLYGYADGQIKPLFLLLEHWHDWDDRIDDILDPDHHTNTATRIPLNDSGAPPAAVTGLEVTGLKLELAYGNYTLVPGGAYTVSGDTDGVESWFDEDRVFHVRGADKRLRNSSITIEIPGDVVLDEISIEAGAAMVDIAQLSCREFDLEAGAADVNLDLLDAYDINLECGAGAVSATLSGSREDYTIEAECAMGSFHLDHEPFLTGLAGEASTGHGPRELDVEVGAGSVEVSFES